MSTSDGAQLSEADLNILKKTAAYVAKNGPVLEQKLKDKQKDNPKFKFLFSDSPYYIIYRDEIQRAKDNQASSDTDQLQRQTEQESESNKNVDTNDDLQIRRRDSPDESSRDRSSPNHRAQPTEDDDRDRSHRPESPQNNGPRVRPMLNDYIQEMTRELKEPPALNYLATSGPYFKQMDSDILKLTAQYIATYGRSFLDKLVITELNNPQFDWDFLKPQHGQYSYMTNLIMQYAIIQNQPLDLNEQLEKDSTSRKHVLDKVRMRADWTKMLELERRKQEEAEEKEKILYGQIDWHDFVIVETINYQPDERGEYPPTTADQVGTRLLIQQRLEEQTAPEEMEIDMEMSSDDESAGDG